MYYDEEGFARLRNKNGYCVFYDAKTRKCRVYNAKPLGCRVYPVMLSEDEKIVADWLCPKKDTVSKHELTRKGKILAKLLHQIDSEKR